MKNTVHSSTKRGFRMKKRAKVLVVSLVALVIVLVIALFLIANYFFNFALVPSSGTSGPSFDLTEDEQAGNANDELTQWLKNTSQDVYIESDDGLKLRGYLGMNPSGSHKYAVLLHGYTGRGSEMAYFAQHYYDQGWNYLIMDFRAHGESEGKYIGMGWLDRLDILDWIDFTITQDPEAEIALHGVSMGGATVMMVTGEKLPRNVKVAVEDCGYTSVYDEFVNQLKDMFGLPPFPILTAASLVTDIRAGYSFKEASSVKQVAKSVTPTLFIHGEDDTFVDFSMLDVVYEAAACEKEKLIVPGAGHARSHTVAPELYWTTVDDFVARYM